ncbi:MAG: LysR family transcriptional regulator [Myxococcota bacterium]|nr:LysR family transcriptional regulator [Myxococcota bacterium]
MNLNDLETFVLVAQEGTFTGAAERLGVPKSTVSRRVARLEEALGLALLQRSGRSFQLTEDGEALMSRCAPALQEIAAVERDLGDRAEAPRGLLRVTASIDLGTTDFLALMLADYSRENPGVELELRVSNRVVDLMEEGVDVGFRTHVAPLPSRDDLMARHLGAVELGAYASPDYLAAHGVPQRVEALKGHPVVSHRSAYLAPCPTEPMLRADDYRPVAALLAAGAGVGVLPRFVAAPLVDAGRLQPLLPDWELKPATLSLVWLRSRHLAPRVRAFIDKVVAHTQRPDWFR